ATSLPSCRWATVDVRIDRKVAAWARPRPSASASARFAKITVSHSQTEIVNVNQPGSLPPRIQAIVVTTAPTSTTNMTGLRTCTRGSSFLTDANSAGPTTLGLNVLRERGAGAGDVGGAAVAVIDPMPG